MILHADFVSTLINLLANLIGLGILALPPLAQTIPTGLFVLLLFLTCVFSWLSTYALSVLLASKLNARSFSEIASDLYSTEDAPVKFLLKLTLGILLLGNSTISFILSTSCLSEVLTCVSPLKLSLGILIGAFAFSLATSLHTLRYVSFASLSCLFIVCISSITSNVVTLKEASSHLTLLKPTNISFLKFSEVSCSLLFSFSCSATVPKLTMEIRDRRRSVRFRNISILVFIFTFFFYLIYSFAGNFYFENKFPDNLLLGLSSFAKLPLYVIPLRDLLFGFRSSLDLHNLVFTICIMFMIFFLFLLIPNFADAVSLVGGTGVVLSSFLFPALLLRRKRIIEYEKIMDMNIPLMNASGNFKEKTVENSLFAISMLVFLVTLPSLIDKLLKILMLPE